MKQKRKSKNSSGTVVIEFNHSGIPDAELKPEEFDEQQLAVLAALPPDRQAEIELMREYIRTRAEAEGLWDPIDEY